MDLFVARASRKDMFNNSFTAFQFSGFPFPGLARVASRTRNTGYTVFLGGQQEQQEAKNGL
jgi:hypothetical protein